MTAAKCAACDKPATDFQCPLCQAEGQETQGFFCSQECFATNWLEHRNTLHKSGVVREKRKEPLAAASPDSNDKKNKKRVRASAAADASDSSDYDSSDDNDGAPPAYVPWPPMPSAATDGIVKPALSVSCPRAVVGAAAGDSALDSFWPLTVAAAHFATQFLEESKKSSDKVVPRVLVVAGEARTAHAFAWAARCAGLGGSLRLIVNAGQIEDANTTTATLDSLFRAQRPVIIVTESVVRSVGGASTDSSGAAELWLDSGNNNEKEKGDAITTAAAAVLITLPDVRDAGDLQGVATRAVFFTALCAADVKKKGSKAAEVEKEEVDPSSPAAASAWAAEENIAHTVLSAAALEALLPQQPSIFADNGLLTISWQPMPSLHNIIDEDDEEDEKDEDEEEEKAVRSSKVATSSTSKDKKASADDDDEDDDDASSEDDDAAVYTVSRQQCLTDKLDNDTATCLANGDYPRAVQHLVRVYSTDPGYYEEVLFNALCCDWGALSLVHAHHRIAYIIRALVDASERFAAAKGGSLADVSLRAAARAVKLLPALVSPAAVAAAAEAKAAAAAAASKASKRRKTETVKPVAATAAVATVSGGPSATQRSMYFNHYNTATLPNLQLQATIVHLFGRASAATLDTLGAAWAMEQYIAGPAALTAAAAGAARKSTVERIQSRYSAKLGKHYAGFLLVLAHLLYDTVAVYSLTVEEVERRLLWGLTLQHDVGPMAQFLNDCGLLHESGDNNGATTPAGKGKGKGKESAKALSSRKTGKNDEATSAAVEGSVNVSTRAHAVRAEHNITTITTTTTTGPKKPPPHLRLPWLPFPITGKRDREIARLHRAALDEVLMALPKDPKPMYIGDVGNLIGKWHHFNSRFDGVLGVSLSEFLVKHPTEFQLAGTLVTRRKTGKSEQIRIRFDQTDYNNTGDASDDDGEGANKARTRDLLTGRRTTAQRKKAADEKLKAIPAKHRKKLAVRNFNKERHNRNYKQIDQDARVPGYTKHGARRITGRGKKVNARNFKRN